MGFNSGFKGLMQLSFLCWVVRQTQWFSCKTLVRATNYRAPSTLSLNDFHCCTVHVDSIISLTYQLMHTLFTLKKH